MTDTGKITLTIHGLEAFHGEVDAEVFADKFAAFMDGLAAADEEANGGRTHKFVLTDLRKNTATAELIERKVRNSEKPARSGIDFLIAGIEEIRSNSPRARNLPKPFVKSVVALNRGATKKFEFGELKTPDGGVLLLNSFLEDRARIVLADIEKNTENLGHYEGVAFGSFDGVLKAVDFQQETKKGTIRLSAGGLPVVCNIGAVSVDEIRKALDQRARYFGRAIYVSSSPLPKVLDVTRIELLERGDDVSLWRGAFASGDDNSWGEM